MKMQEQKTDSILILSLEGEIMGGKESKVLQDRIYEAIREGSPFVIMDMGKVSWINSAGLGSLMACLTTLRGSGGDLRLAQVPDRVRRPIEITRLDKVLLMFESSDEARKNFVEGA